MYISGKYDYPCIISPLIKALESTEENFNLKTVTLIKKGAQYFTISTSKFVFNDTLHFSAPCNYSKYLKQWGISENKSIFPYTKYNSVEDLNADTEFPSYADFFSELTGKLYMYILLYYLKLLTRYECVH